MKSTLLTRAAPALLLAAALACGGSISSLAATTSTDAGQQNATTASTATGTTGMSSAGSSATDSNQATAPSSTATTATAGSNNAAGGQQTMQQMAEQRIDELHSQLQITARQQPVWDKFAKVMRDNARQLDQAYEQRGQTFDSMNAVSNMKSYAKIEQTRARDVQKLVPAFEAVYASLSTQQKQEADTLFRNRSESAQQRRNQSAQQATH